jgi:hypothetical protein
MTNNETYLGSVEDVNGTTVSVLTSNESLTGFIYINGQGYRSGQVGSFVRIPIGFIDLFGIISQVGARAVPDNVVKEQPYGNRWMTIQLMGEGQRNGFFQRGISQYPTIGDEVHLVSENELQRIYGQPDKPFFVKLGHISNAESIPALIDINKLITSTVSTLKLWIKPLQFDSCRISCELPVNAFLSCVSCVLPCGELILKSGNIGYPTVQTLF